MGDVPAGFDALLLLSVEELAVNELRETFRHWVRTLAFPVRDGRLLEALSPQPAFAWRGGHPTSDLEAHAAARDLMEEVDPDLKRFLAAHAQTLTSDLRRHVETEGIQARERERERYQSRHGEVSSLIVENTLAKLEKEIGKLKVQRSQGLLFDEAERLETIDRSIAEKEEEIARRKRHYEEVRDQLERERKRILDYLLPKRHAMAGPAQVFPVSIEVRLPGGAA